MSNPVLQYLSMNTRNPPYAHTRSQSFSPGTSAFCTTLWISKCSGPLSSISSKKVRYISSVARNPHVTGPEGGTSEDEPASEPASDEPASEESSSEESSSEESSSEESAEELMGSKAFGKFLAYAGDSKAPFSIANNENSRHVGENLVFVQPPAGRVYPLAPRVTREHRLAYAGSNVLWQRRGGVAEHRGWARQQLLDAEGDAVVLEVVQDRREGPESVRFPAPLRKQ
ncbi:hypothetical protein PG994_009905 [Apiospora phragmitis]|uniref:Uncharacterized protein n=1 Tax=Apiospora phragmitis TaxID=2905665 RepID=A0ABR1TND4_9PEZI